MIIRVGWFVAAGDISRVVFNSGRFVGLAGLRWQGDLVGGRDGAAALDEFGVDLAARGGAERPVDVLAALRVVGGVGVVADEYPVENGGLVFPRTPVSAAGVWRGVWGSRSGVCC